MKIFKSLLTRAAILAVCGLFLASCGGGSGGGSSATTINGISVPPEPDATQNNATLAGVDSNANGVRDDVERKIAENTATGNQFNFENAINRAQNNSRIVTESLNNSGIVEDIYKKMICLSKNNIASQLVGINSIEAIQFNTEERIALYNKYQELISGKDSLDVVDKNSGEIDCAQ